jgi:adenylyltransferase/sulfurtransferase
LSSYETAVLEHRFHRQLGLVDQDAVESLRVSISGDSDLTLAVLSQLASIGIGCAEDGAIRLVQDARSELGESRHKWIFDHLGEVATWEDLASSIESIYGVEVVFGDDSEALHLHCDRGESTGTTADLYATAWHGQAVISRQPLRFTDAPNVEPCLLDSSLETALAATSAQHILALAGVVREDALSDRWISLTARVEDMTPEEVLKRFSSKYGNPTVTMLPDSKGSVLRFRIPLDETHEALLRSIDHACKPPLKLANDWVMPIGPFPISTDNDGKVLATDLDLPAHLENANVLVLGTGGLGSWATPLFSAGIAADGLRLSLVDADDSVDVHNLNRQVLYTPAELGLAKAPAAARRMISLLPEGANVTAIQHRLEERHTISEQQIVTTPDAGMVSLDEVVGAELVCDDRPLLDAIDQMDIALACLDNQFARTMLNRSCQQHGVPMINGGGEGFSGVVEVLDGNVCMVCRYGEGAAREQEVVSCQETGGRPVASIVTTTAWVGAMQAALALLELLKLQQGIDRGHLAGLAWNDGTVHERPVAGLPWIEGACSSHL